MRAGAVAGPPAEPLRRGRGFPWKGNPLTPLALGGLLPPLLLAVHLGLVTGDVATLCARRAVKITRDSFRLLP